MVIYGQPMMNTEMTPQEMFEYKREWKMNNCYSVQVDMDSHIWGKDWCRKHIERQDWSFDKHTRPDDSHTFNFKNPEPAGEFLKAYKEYNPRFPTTVLVG